MGGKGVQCGTALIFCVPAFAAIGLVGGTVYGAVAGDSQDVWQHAEEVFLKKLADADLENGLAKRMSSYARASHLTVLFHSDGNSATTGVPGAHPGDTQERPANLLEIDGPYVTLAPTYFKVNPQRQFVLTAAVKLTRVADHHVLFSGKMSDDMGPTRSVQEWMADDGRVFSEELPLAEQRLAERIIDDLFMKRVAPAHSIHLNPLFDATVKGVEPAYPPINIMNMSHSELQPTMRWQPFTDGENVVYDLCIWRARAGMRGEVVYSRYGLKTSWHALEKPLEPATRYYWSVRVHYDLNGTTQQTEWSTFRLTPTRLGNLSSMGMASLMNVMSNDIYFRFVTSP